MAEYILALDQGTTSSRSVIYNKRGKILAMSQKELRQIYPKPGWVEHDPEEIWDAQLSVMREVMIKAGVSCQDIAAIGITNQRETTILWDRNTGKPAYNAIVWQCRRTADYCKSLIEKHEKTIRQKTGLPVDPYFSATKIRWILDNVDGVREKAKNGDILFGTVETWLIWKLTGGRVHVTDHSNAARTMLFNIHTLMWDEELLAVFDIPGEILPTPVPNSMIYGETDPSHIGEAIPIAGAAGDQQAALFGQLCINKLDGKMTYGTGGFMLLNTGCEMIESKNGLISTVAWTLGEKTDYALEGSIFVEGAVIQWLRDELGLIESAQQSEEMATSVSDTNGVYLVPAFTGMGSPYWDPYARGLICGLTRGTNKAHIVRAALEAMAYQTKDLADAMQEDLGDRIRTIKADGGASANDFLMQFQANVLQTDLVRPQVLETTSLGAAYLAGLAVGYWSGTEEIKQNEEIDTVFHPIRSDEEIADKLDGWHQAVQRAGIQSSCR